VIEILYCGVCHSDFHVIFNEWKNTEYPIIAGHEIIGIVRKIGKSVKKFKVNDIVGLGPNYNSCRFCKECKMGDVQYCENGVVEAYNFPDRKFDKEKDPTGPITQGGYSNVTVANENYLIKINSKELSELPKIAPILCAGVTVYTPLKTLLKAKGTKCRVGIAGIGGLGHFAVKLAKAMGFEEVFALTTSEDKIGESVELLGAHEALLATDLKELREYNMTFDLILCTVPFPHDATPYICLLKQKSTLWFVGNLFPMTIDFELVIRKGVTIKGSTTGSIKDTQDLVNFCVAKKLFPEIELIDIQEINNIYRDIVTRRVRYRYVIDMESIYRDV